MHAGTSNAFSRILDTRYATESEPSTARNMTPKQAIKVLRWAVEQSEEWLGTYTGGPQEQEYRERLAQARMALHVLETLLSTPQS